MLGWDPSLLRCRSTIARLTFHTMGIKGRGLRISLTCKPSQVFLGPISSVQYPPCTRAIHRGLRPHLPSDLITNAFLLDNIISHLGFRFLSPQGLLYAPQRLSQQISHPEVLIIVRLLRRKSKAPNTIYRTRFDQKSIFRGENQPLQPGILREFAEIAGDHDVKLDSFSDLGLLGRKWNGPGEVFLLRWLGRSENAGGHAFGFALLRFR